MGSDNRFDGFSWRLAAFYAAFFGFSGIVMPFFPAWLQAKGLNARDTGIVLAVPMFMRLISVPSVARLADRRSAFRGALISSALGSASAYLVLSQASGFLPIVLAVVLASFATAPTMPLLDAYALKGLALRGRAYGPVRLWGSVAFVFANLGAGFIIDRIAPIQIIWLLFGSLVIAAAVSLTRPIAPDERRKGTLRPGSHWSWRAAWRYPVFSMPILAIAPMQRWRWLRFWVASSCR